MNPNWRKDYMRYKSYYLDVVGRYKDRADVKLYLELLLSLVTVSVFAIFALRPTLLTISNLVKEIEAKRETIKRMDDKIDDIIRAQTLADQERNRISMLQIAVPDNPDPDIVLRQFEGLLSKYNAAFLNFDIDEIAILGANASTPVNTIQAQRQTANLGEQIMTFSIRLTTDYEGLYNFLADAEKLRRPIKFKIVDFSKDEANNDETITLTISGEIPVTRNNKQ